MSNRPTGIPRELGDRLTRNRASTLIAPTVEEMEQVLAVPLAFVEPPLEAGFAPDQLADLARIATQFNASVSASDLAPTEPAYAETYHDYRNLADEQVWSVSGQAAYEALVDARAQAAGNIQAPSP